MKNYDPEELAKDIQLTKKEIEAENKHLKIGAVIASTLLIGTITSKCMDGNNVENNLDTQSEISLAR